MSERTSFGDKELSLALHGFAIALFLFVVVRGSVLSFLLPPFEGWDEYQHLATAEYVYLHNKFPSIEETVPEPMWDYLRSTGHPDESAKQLPGLGVRNYRGEVWNQAMSAWVLPSEIEIKELKAQRLYQSQQGPLYYYLLAYLKRGLSPTAYQPWADTARFVNVVLYGLSLVMWVYILTLTSNRRRYSTNNIRMSMVLAALCPLAIYNAARVGNDVLAIFFASSAILLYYLLLRAIIDSKSKIQWKIIGGFLLIGLISGLAVISKALAIVVLPVLLLGTVYRFKKRRWQYAGAIAIGYLLMAGVYHYESFVEWGSVIRRQESLTIGAIDASWLDMATALLDIDPSRLRDVFLIGLFETNAWSHPKTLVYPGIASVTRLMIVLSVLFLLGSSLHRWFMNRPSLECRRGELYLLVATMWAALIVQMTTTILAYGAEIVETRYSVLVFPVIFFLLIAGPFEFSKVTKVFFCAFGAILIAVYYLVTFELLLLTSPETSTLAEAIARSCAIHGTFSTKGIGKLLVIEFGLISWLILVSSVGQREGVVSGNRAPG